MNYKSISGKTWIYKKFDHNYVSFLKENFSIDEIVAQLLSIRNINKDNVESFLKPSIKDYIPNDTISRKFSKLGSLILFLTNHFDFLK